MLENFPKYTPEEKAEIKKKRKRVDNLRKTDSKYENSVLGLAKIENKFRKKLAEKNIFGEDANELADDYSDQTLEKNEAQKESRMDALTGLQNRRDLDISAPKILNLVKREKDDCALLILDLDYFKKVNDEFGHRVGDDVLRYLAKTIRESLRQSDHAYRYGGEELVVLLPGINSEEACIAAEKIRETIEKKEIKLFDTNGQEIKVKKTVSIGVSGTDQISFWKNATSGEMGAVLAEMISRADRAAYESKDLGRNRVTLFEVEG